MSVADAIVQLNLLHEPFLVFRHDTDGRVAVVYKREDGSYGLIETPTAARRKAFRGRGRVDSIADEDRRPDQARHGRSRAARRPTSAASSRSLPRTWPRTTRGSIARRSSRVLIEREQLASTAIGEGVAIPHGKLGAVGEIVACLGPRADRRRVRLDGRSADVPVLRAGRARVVDRRAPEGARADQPRVQGSRVPPPAAWPPATPRRCTAWWPTRTPSTRCAARDHGRRAARTRGARRHRDCRQGRACAAPSRCRASRSRGSR